MTVTITACEEKTEESTVEQTVCNLDTHNNNNNNAEFFYLLTAYHKKMSMYQPIKVVICGDDGDEISKLRAPIGTNHQANEPAQKSVAKKREIVIEKVMLDEDSVSGNPKMHPSGTKID